MPRVSRRDFVAILASAAPVLVVPRRAAASSTVSRVLRFSHLHTGERLDVEYFAHGEYQSGALGAIDHLLRDFRTGEAHAIDQKLLDLLHGLSSLIGTRQPYQVISGYRSPVTNRMLRSRSEGVAARSLHMQGQAIDIRLADVALPTLRDAALSMHGGGVGYYLASNFVHVDTGRVRTW
jgi:uncharacterized protein YcbK (DUF882 family)